MLWRSRLLFLGVPRDATLVTATLGLAHVLWRHQQGPLALAHQTKEACWENDA